MLCGNSHTLTELVVFRILQGLGRRANIQCTGNITRDLATGEKEPLLRYLVSDSEVGPTVAPALGGYLTDHLSVAMGILY